MSPQDLAITGAVFTNTGAESIARAIERLPGLRDVNVSGNRIGDAGFLAIAKSSVAHIRHLNVSACGISCRGADEGLSILYASDNTITLLARENHGEDSFKKAEVGTCVAVSV